MTPLDNQLAALRPRLVRHARVLLSDRAAAEDLVQDTLLAVIELRAPWRGEAALSSWATGILRHKAADWHRNVRNRLASSLVDDDDDDAQRSQPAHAPCAQCRHPGRCLACGSEPERAFERSELVKAIDQCMTHLPQLAAQVFMLRECLGVDTAQVCERLAISPENCRTLLHRARRSLRACLEASRPALQ